MVSGKTIRLALLKLYDKITSAINRKECTVGIFLDLTKSFDTVNYQILFDKLEHYSIRGIALDWFKNYFLNRVQYVQYDWHELNMLHLRISNVECLRVLF